MRRDVRQLGGLELANIGPRERNVRRWLGIALLAVGTALTWLLVSRGGPPAWWWGIIFFALYYQAVRFVLDSQTGTCPIKAELCERNMSGTFTLRGERIEDERLAYTLRQISRRSALFSMVAAAVLTAVSMWTAAG